MTHIRLCCEFGVALTRCTAKLRTAVLPQDALEAIMLAVTCCILAEKCRHVRMCKTHLLEFEFSGVDQVQRRSKPIESRSFHPRMAWKKGRPTNTKRVNDEEKKHCRDPRLDGLEDIDLDAGIGPALTDSGGSMHTWYNAAPRPPIMVPKTMERKVKGGSSSSLRSTRYLETSLPLVMTGSPLTKSELLSSSSPLRPSANLSGIAMADSFSCSTKAAFSLKEGSEDEYGIREFFCGSAITGGPMPLGETRGGRTEPEGGCFCSIQPSARSQSRQMRKFVRLMKQSTLIYDKIRKSL